MPQYELVCKKCGTEELKRCLYSEMLTHKCPKCGMIMQPKMSRNSFTLRQWRS